MYLEKLAIHGIRNIQRVECALSPGINIFYGRNGSGKTSILEAVHLLSRGRSFRTRNLKTLISHNLKECTCFGLVNTGTGAGNAAIPVGVNRTDNGNFVFKVAGEQVATASRLAEALPVQLINAESFDLLNGPPAGRRGFLDWGVFHVEHNYRELWARFQRCLKHRNSLLRHAKIDALQLAVWDREFVTLSEKIAAVREKYIQQLLPVVTQTLEALGQEADYSFRFLPGWDSSESLFEQLQASLLRDQKVGFTQAGSHRADVKILCGKGMAADVLSRGQAKMLVSALKLAQGILFKELAGKQCIFLLDDLPAELDRPHRLAVGRVLMEMGVQVLVTGVEKTDLIELWNVVGDGYSRPAVFHVEHGQVSREAYQ
ncbi:MAG: DNA replication/repair protein RecF [Porticoccaceae bacterium]|nr:DNA replication/repair protein RecF [Porticoccaceae bacterium]